MKKKLIFLNVTIAALMVGNASAATVWVEGTSGEDDAGDIADTPPERTLGSGNLDLITGTTTQPDDEVDAYFIDISDPASFYATANPAIGMGTGFGLFDSRLFLFTIDGDLVMGNDDTQNAPGQTQRSTISAPEIWEDLTGGALGTSPPAPLTPGPYILAITDWDNDPLDPADTPMTSIASPNHLSLGGPEPGLTGPINSWSGNRGVDPSAGDYGIELVGAVFASGQIPFLITDIEVEESEVTLTWNSRANKTYTIERSADLDGWLELTDGYEADGESTSYVDSELPVEKSELYYRIKQEE